MRIDHVLLVTADIDACARRLGERFGLTSTPGGEHPGWGTGNTLIPAGDQYVEILGIRDPRVACANPIGAYITAMSMDGDRLAGLALRCEDLDAVCSRLGLAAMPGSRTLPDGSLLTWRLAGVRESMVDRLPFFIEWNDPRGGLGGVTSPTATGITRVELGGDVAQVSDWLGEEVAGVTLVGGEPGVRAATIATTTGEVALPERL